MGSKAKLKKVKRMANIKSSKQKEIEKVEEISSISSAEEERMILNSAIHPPYNIILDTNFINDCIRKKQDLENVLIDCLDANVKLYVPECVLSELEKLGRVFRVATSMIKRLNITRLTCQHKGTYADDCILKRVTEFKCYIVATTDVGLRQRIKKIPGVPVVYFKGRSCATERFAGPSL